MTLTAFSLLLLCCVYQLDSQTFSWYTLEPTAKKPLMSMFSAIYNYRLYLIGGEEASVSSLDVNDIFINDYNEITPQPDLNVMHAEWQTEAYWYNLNYGLFCNQSCTTQINRYLYIVAPYKNRSGLITQTGDLFVYDLKTYRFLAQSGYTHKVPISVQNGCIVNNQTHLFIIGGGDYDDAMITYDMEHNLWTLMNATLQMGRKNFGCSFDVNRTKIFVFGGDIAWNESTSSIEVYDMRTQQWSLLTTTSAADVDAADNMTSTTSSAAAPITLSFRRSRLNCVLHEREHKIYIFGGGGCSEIDHVCVEFRNLVEVFDVDSYAVTVDRALLKSAVSDSYSSLYLDYTAYSGAQQGSYFRGIFVVGGRTELRNSSYEVQYRIPDGQYEIVDHEVVAWTAEPLEYALMSVGALLLVVLLVGVIVQRVWQYTDTRLRCVLLWFVLLCNSVLDMNFNVHLWSDSGVPILAAFSTLFLVIRLAYNIGYSLRVALLQWKRDITIRERVNEWLQRYMSPCCGGGDDDDDDDASAIHAGGDYDHREWLIYVCAVLSGSSHGFINLANSNLFGAALLNMGLVDRHLIEYNLTRLPSEVLFGNIPQFTLQLLYYMEWASVNHADNKSVYFALAASFVSFCVGIAHIVAYRNSPVPVRKLMLDEDFTRPHFLILKSHEIYEVRHRLIHRSAHILNALSTMIDVPPSVVEVNLCHLIPSGIKLSFVEYSGTKNSARIVAELRKSIEDGYLQSAVQYAWQLQETPVVEIWNQQNMYEHKQMFTDDFAVKIRQSYIYKQKHRTLDCSCMKCCPCLQHFGDLVKVSSQRQ